MANYEFFYEGTPYSLEPGYGEAFIGYRVPHSEIGAPTSIQTANQIQEVTNLLNQGIKTVELQPISPEVFDQIPKQHFKEIARLQKLAGAETTVHAPMVEPSGLTKEGWSETDRESAERQLKTVVEKSHQLSPEGNIPITIHASAIPGAEFSPASKELTEKYKKQFRGRRGRDPTPEEIKTLGEKRIVAINQETKQMTGVEREVKYYPETGEEVRVPRRELDIMNNSEWINSVTNLAFYEKHANETIANAYGNIAQLILKENAGEKISRKEFMEAAPSLKAMESGEVFLGNAEAAFRTLFHKAYKYGEDNTRRELDNISNEWRKQAQKTSKKIMEARAKGRMSPLQSVDMIQKRAELINKTINGYRKIEGDKEIMVRGLKDLAPPKVYKPVEDFAGDHSSTTFANVALHAYEKYGNKAPIISVENLYPGMAFSRSEQLKKLVDDSREKFIIEAVKKGHSKSDAETAAKRTIGVTWDVGHLNMIRKGGFKKEDIIKETKAIAPYVKHVHLTDNFGYSDSHLPPGMGNVPTKEILQELKKKGFAGKKIIEAGAFVQHFKVPPTQAVLEALGSPLYTMMAAPYWNQAIATHGSYFSGYGPILPEQHFSMYGAGWSGMPTELGGQMPGKQSRFAGSPTE